MRTVRSECLDWLLILNQEHLERVLDVFVAHYNGHRPHRALALTPPNPTRSQSCRRRVRLVSSVAIVSVAWFTSMSWRRDQVFAPYHGRRRHSVRLATCISTGTPLLSSIRAPRVHLGSGWPSADTCNATTRQAVTPPALVSIASFVGPR